MPGMTYHVLVNVTQKAKRVFARLELVQPDDPRLAALAGTLPSTDRYPEKTYERYQRQNEKSAQAILGKILNTENDKKTFQPTDGVS